MWFSTWATCLRSDIPTAGGPPLLMSSSRKVETKVVSRELGQKNPLPFIKKPPKTTLNSLVWFCHTYRGSEEFVGGLEARLLNIHQCKVTLLIHNAHSLSGHMTGLHCLVFVWFRPRTLGGSGKQLGHKSTLHGLSQETAMDCHTLLLSSPCNKPLTGFGK